MKHKQIFSILTWAYRRKPTDKEVTLYARTVNGKRAEISLSKRINAALWDEENSTVKNDSDEADEINEFLDIARGELRQHYYQLRSEKKLITAEAIKNRYLGIEEKEDRKTLLEVFKFHNDEMKGLIGKGISEGTYKKVCGHTRKDQAISEGKIYEVGYPSLRPEIQVHCGLRMFPENNRRT